VSRAEGRAAFGSRMHGPGLLPGQAQPVQQIEHAVPALTARRSSTSRRRSSAVPLLEPSGPGSGPRSTIDRQETTDPIPGRNAARSRRRGLAAIRPSSRNAGRPLRGRSRRPSTPSSLKRITRSLGVWRSRIGRSRCAPSEGPRVSRRAKGRPVLPRRRGSCRRGRSPAPAAGDPPVRLQPRQPRRRNVVANRQR
jgi:hypothetical protein